MLGFVVPWFLQESFGPQTARRPLQNSPYHPGLNSREPNLGFRTRLFSLVFGRLRTLAICFELSKCFVEPFVCHFSLLIIGIPRGCKPSGRHGLPLHSLTRVVQ